MNDTGSDPASGDTPATISAGCLGNDLLRRCACKADEQAIRLLNDATSNERISKPDETGVFMIEGGIKEVWIDAFFIDPVRPVSSFLRWLADS